ncbi:MAG: MFS transporter, partial [Bryobacteraceae bacterium]
MTLGLRANLAQFALLMAITGFIGATVGLERTVIPLLAKAEFGIASRTAALSFLITFGLVKALANLFAGALASRAGRRRILIAGWLAGLAVPVAIIVAPGWSWILFANVLLGLNQGLCWS